MAIATEAFIQQTRRVNVVKTSTGPKPTSMKNKLPIEINKADIRLLLGLSLFSIFSITLLAGRMYATGYLTFKFLVWNLFLAWMPLGFAAAANRVHGIAKRPWLALGFAAGWLLFFPNAPYILTDLFHLRPRGIPYWFDLLLILSFAVNGLLLGLASLFEIHSWLNRHYKAWIGWAVIGTALIAGGYGIYLGRYLRWNSWDIIKEPVALLQDTLRPLLHPFDNKETIAMTLGFAAFMGLCYLVLRNFGKDPYRKEEQYPVSKANGQAST